MVAAAADGLIWRNALEELKVRLGALFVRPEPRHQAGLYLEGLLSSVERKNGWQLAEQIGDARPWRTQRVLSHVLWDEEAARDLCRAYVVEHLGAPDGVLIVDETGFLKKGEKSAGVQRQDSGTAGRIENCQIGVFLGYASRHGRALIDRALYLPEDWAKDMARRAQAHIPPAVAFTTKPKLALAMLERAREAGLPFAWVTGDSVYGADHTLRRWAERQRCGYVLAVTSGQRLGARPVTTWIEDLPKTAWQRLSAGEGAKGPRRYDWAYVPYAGGAAGFRCGLLVRRSRAAAAKLTFYLTQAPAGTTLADLVRVAGMRWPIEECFEVAKQEVGLADYEIRSWHGWYRHITLAMFALAFLAAMRIKLNAVTPRKRGQRRLDLWSISAQAKSAISSAGFNALPA